MDELAHWPAEQIENHLTAEFEKQLREKQLFDKHLVKVFEEMCARDPSTPIGQVKTAIEDSWRLKNLPALPATTAEAAAAAK